MIRVQGITDVGLVRKENQDAYAVREETLSGHTVCVVCDGMGGPGGGKLASELAVETFLAVCRERLRADMSARNVQTVAESAVKEANTAIYQRSCSDRLRGMGTTLVSAIAWDGQALVSNVGDSRAYRIPAGGGITRIRKKFFAFFFILGIEFQKIGLRHINFAADFQNLRDIVCLNG